VRVVIISESALGANSIRWCFKYSANLEVIGALDARRPCAESVRDVQAGVVLIDEMHARDVLLARIAELRAALPTVKLVLLARDMDTASLDEAARAGIDAAISRDVDPASLGMLVRQIGRGAIFHSFARPSTPKLQSTSCPDLLTAREREILRLVAHGYSNSRVAAKLWVTEQTVKFHLSNVYRKLGVANRTEASRYAYMNGLLDVDEAVDAVAPAVTGAVAA
jgi:DNA-binding NarL/FixJ family response regulator